MRYRALEQRRLSAAQLGIWFAQTLAPQSPIYNIGEYYEILGPLDSGAFEMALRQVVAETDALHLHFVETDEGPMQYIEADPDWVMPFIDVSAETDPRAAAEALMREDMDRVVDLVRGPLFGYMLLRAAPDRFFWYSRYHHLCNDGFGVSLVAQRLAARYTSLVQGSCVEVEDGGSWFDLLDEEEAYRLSPCYQRDRAYWCEQLLNCPAPVTLSGKFAGRSRRFIRCTDYLPRSFADALRTLGATSGSSLSQVITAAGALYMHRLTGAQDLVLGVPVAARLGARMFSRISGMVSNILPLRLNIDPKDRFSDLLRQTSRRMREMLRRQRYRCEDLRIDLGLRPDEPEVYGGVVNVIPFNYDLSFAGQPARGHQFSNLPVDELSIAAIYDRQSDSDLRIDFDANPANYTVESIGAHERRFLALLVRLTAVPRDRPLYGLEILEPEERRQLLEGFNATQREVPEATLPELFEAQVERTPEAEAVFFEEELLTYGNLTRGPTVWRIR